jgi:hypothetical protein
MSNYMANDITNAEVYQDIVDEELVAASKSGFLTPNEELVEYDGGDTVKIAEIDVSGLGDYDADNIANAFPKGSVSTRWRDYTFSQDRGVEFPIDRMAPSDSRISQPPRTSSASLPAPSWYRNRMPTASIAFMRRLRPRPNLPRRMSRAWRR